MEEEEANETAEEIPVWIDNKPERYNWLFLTLDKKIDRFDTARKSLYQKAIWTLATATGAFGFSGLAKGESISGTIGKITSALHNAEHQPVETIECIILAIFFTLVVVYFSLLRQVIQAYDPIGVAYPVLLVKPEFGPIVSRHDDEDANRELGDRSWDYTMEKYFESDDLLFQREVLRNHIDVIIEHYSLNQKLDRQVDSAFNLLKLSVVLSVLLFILA